MELAKLQIERAGEQETTYALASLNNPETEFASAAAALLVLLAEWQDAAMPRLIGMSWPPAFWTVSLPSPLLKTAPISPAIAEDGII
jgi:hypothetical protein